jgi:dTDP-4-amino-4,6-dideoxygalactose transaminase
MVGVNSRLDEVQAAILRVKLTALDAGNARRQAIAAAYDAALAGGPIAPPARRAGAEHVFHQYVLRVPERAR